MSSVLQVHDLRLTPKGAAISLAIRPGQVVSVYGPAGSGKTQFLRALASGDKGRKGAVRLLAEPAIAGFPAISSRSTPESLARKVAGRSSASLVAEAIAAAGLWNQRRIPFAILSPGQQAACELSAILAGPFGFLGIDGQLERLDPWTRRSILELLGNRLSKGAVAAIVTSLADLAPRSDVVTVWRDLSPVYAGSYQDLERRVGWTQFEVETLHEPSTRALCDPFEVSVKSVDGALSLKAKEGQALAASLLLEGYGDVKAVVERPPTPEEVLNHV